MFMVIDLVLKPRYTYQIRLGIDALPKIAVIAMRRRRVSTKTTTRRRRRRRRRRRVSTTRIFMATKKTRPIPMMSEFSLSV
jgi:hypothetical protein